MATQFFSQPSTVLIADYKNFLTNFSNALIALGLIQTADTGQVVISSATLPSATSLPGAGSIRDYMIFRMNDSKQGTAPVYFRFDFGNSNGSVFGIYITAGTGSNGAGTITGAGFNTGTTGNMVSNGGPVVTEWRLCSVDGYFMIWAGPNNGASHPLFMMTRSVDDTGAVTDVAVEYWNYIGVSGGGDITARSISYTGGVGSMIAQIGALATTVLLPYGIPSLAVGTDTQAILHWWPTPRIRPAWGRCSMQLNAFTNYTTFAATLVGATALTYITLNAMGPNGISGNTNFRLALLWQ